MKQSQIHDLLIEAANPACTAKRRNQIQILLDEAVVGAGLPDSDERLEGMQVVLDTLYTSTLENRSYLLPTLLPVFALMCGDKEDIVVAEIDWEQIDPLEQSPNWEKYKDNTDENRSGFPYDEGFPTGAYVGKFYTLVLCDGDKVENCSVDDSSQYMSEGKQWKIRGNSRDRAAVMGWKEQKGYIPQTWFAGMI